MCVCETHLLLTDEQLLSPQNHKAVLPDRSEDPFPTELSDPADLVRLKVLWCRLLWALQTGSSSCQQEADALPRKTALTQHNSVHL